MAGSRREGGREQGVDHEHQQQDGIRGSNGVLVPSTSTATFLVHLAVEEDLVLLIKRLREREIEVEMGIGTEIVIGIVIGTVIGTVIEIGIEKKIKTDIGTETHVVGETIIEIPSDIIGKVATMASTGGTRVPNPAEGAHAVVVVAIAAAEVAGEREAGIRTMRKAGESELEAGVAIGMMHQEDIGAGVATTTVSVTEIEISIVNVTETVRDTGIAGESRMLLQGLEAEVGRQEGSLLVGTRAPSKHCIMAHVWVNYAGISLMESIDHYIHIVQV
jgi:hypothetical protein